MQLRIINDEEVFLLLFLTCCFFLTAAVLYSVGREKGDSAGFCRWARWTSSYLRFLRDIAYIAIATGSGKRKGKTCGVREREIKILFFFFSPSYNLQVITLPDTHSLNHCQLLIGISDTENSAYIKIFSPSSHIDVASCT